MDAWSIVIRCQPRPALEGLARGGTVVKFGNSYKVNSRAQCRENAVEPAEPSLASVRAASLKRQFGAESSVCRLRAKRM